MMKNYIEGNEPFFTDIKKSIKTKIIILLDHSSSISSDAIEYKKATIALCEVLAFLKVNLQYMRLVQKIDQWVCWSIKEENVKME